MATSANHKLREVIPSFFYSLLFYFLAFIVIVLALITPADLIYQSVKNNTLSNVISFAAVLVLTAVVCLLIWATRLYTNRTVLRAIPKDYVAVDKGDVPKKVRKMIEKEWRRCARIAWEGRPRDLRRDLEVLDKLDQEQESGRRGRKKHLHHHLHLPPLSSGHVLSGSGSRDNGRKRSTDLSGAVNNANNHIALFLDGSNPDTNTIIPIRTTDLAWGKISHPGWSLGPLPEDFSQSAKPVEYHTVISELPHLLEARAVSLAPATYLSSSSSASSASESTERGGAPDPRLVTLLQRPRGSSLRDYTTRLLDFGVVSEAHVERAFDFTDKYENARFGAKAISGTEFDDLVAAFAELLNCMSLDVNKIRTMLESGLDDTADEQVSVSGESGFSFQMSSTSEEGDDADDSRSILVGY